METTINKALENFYRENNWPLVQVFGWENVERSISFSTIGPLEIEVMIKGRKALDQKMISITGRGEFNMRDILFSESKKLVATINRNQERIYGLPQRPDTYLHEIKK